MNHAHNFELHLAAELGIPFTLAWVGWILWLLSSATASFVRLPPGCDRTLRETLLGILVIAAVISQVNLAVLHDDRLEVPLWTSLALLVAPLGGPVSARRTRQEPVPSLRPRISR
jgi:O-antigen ligase